MSQGDWGAGDHSGPCESWTYFDSNAVKNWGRIGCRLLGNERNQECLVGIEPEQGKLVLFIEMQKLCRNQGRGSGRVAAEIRSSVLDILQVTYLLDIQVCHFSN